MAARAQSAERRRRTWIAECTPSHYRTLAAPSGSGPAPKHPGILIAHRTVADTGAGDVLPFIEPLFRPPPPRRRGAPDGVPPPASGRRRFVPGLWGHMTGRTG